MEVTNETMDGVVPKSGNRGIKCVSPIDTFTPEQVQEHIDSLRLDVGQSNDQTEKNGHSKKETLCQLCRVDKLTFESPPISCSPCGARIKWNAVYYTVATVDTRHFFCIPCYNESGETIEVEGQPFLKAKLEEKRNDEECEEWWVQCDKCQHWQHQICALYNGRQNDGGKAEYTCPNCYVEEVKCGLRRPLPQSVMLGAKDLPRTVLSDHIENRLFKRLKQELLDRASVAGKSFDEVIGVEGLVVRVVSSVDRKLEVKPFLSEMFQEDSYPTEFPYKSKAVLLFQKIEGVEVCLFGMYVQEFGAECSFPNQRRVYLSCLDYVKYFRPEIKIVPGQDLHAFVYHEILDGQSWYLHYCKLRGFTSCCICACPPLISEDYILYCNPEFKDTQNPDKLHEWYISMLEKATKEEIVVEHTNLYDHFFITKGECKAKVTAARLPYFDSDYWPRATEDMIIQLHQEEDDLETRGNTNKIISNRDFEAAGITDLSRNTSKDAMLMQKLGETIYPMKENFIVAHLQYSCNRCCALMVSGKRWVCHQCINFCICEKCYDAEQQLDRRCRHPSNSRDTHTLQPVDIVGVLEDTKDRDGILENEFFDTRQAFLSLCQREQYQYDTLRRAKHSSMMVLYHLHNPWSPAFVTTCSLCYQDTETGYVWLCEVCPDFDVCNACYQSGGANHPHKLTNHPSAAYRVPQNMEARRLRLQILRKCLIFLYMPQDATLVVVSIWSAGDSRNCFNMVCSAKDMLQDVVTVAAKCGRYFISMSEVARIQIARCQGAGMDVKDLRRGLEQLSSSRRRAAVIRMMRQRAAGVPANQ
ncbi:hypothetical protein ACP70R_030002 [Stipagrostis hirtigluma subsp. patula]